MAATQSDITDDARTRLILMALAVLGPSPSLSADTLVIESVVQSDDVVRPSKGESMAAVESRCGKPVKTAPAVGQPPITRWFYERFTVYFESA